MQRKTSSRGASKTRLKRSSVGRTRRCRAHPCRAFRLRVLCVPALVLRCLALEPPQVARRACRSAASQMRRCSSIQSSAPSSASGSRWHGRNCASRRREIRPLRSSTLRCLEMPGSDMSNGAASSLTVASPVRQAAHDGPPGGVGQRGEGRIEPVVGQSVVTVASFNLELVSCQVKYRPCPAAVPFARRPVERPAPEGRERRACCSR